MNRLSLSSRIALLLGLSAVILLGGAALIMDQLVDAEVGRRMDTALLTQAQTLASLIDTSPRGLDLEDVRKPRPQWLSHRAVEYWSVRCDDGHVATSQPAPPAQPTDWFTTVQDQPAFASLHTKRHALRAVWFRFEPGMDDEAARGQLAGGSATCSVLFMHSRDAMNDILAVIDDILLLIPLLAVLAVLLLTPLLVRRGLKPLAALGEAMRGIGPQAPGQRLQATGTRELEPLVARFNGVLTRMDEGVARERQFAGALAHETRTHLAELRSLVEVERRYPSERPVNELLDEIGHIVGELQGTVSGLLLLTRLEAGIEGMDPDKVLLGDVVDRQLESVADVLSRREIHVDESSISPDTALVVDRALLDIILSNLLNNAAAYAPKGSTIGIHSSTQALVIDNDAPDVDATEVPRFGQRFWSKHHGVAGHARLGLALAGAAATAMHMELHFTLHAQHRLRATLSWPKSLEVA